MHSIRFGVQGIPEELEVSEDSCVEENSNAWQMVSHSKPKKNHVTKVIIQ